MINEILHQTLLLVFIRYVILIYCPDTSTFNTKAVKPTIGQKTEVGHAALTNIDEGRWTPCFSSSAKIWRGAWTPGNFKEFGLGRDQRHGTPGSVL